jgi:DNA polymerase I - 3''-5'' exonuclease and polymerase domains
MSRKVLDIETNNLLSEMLDFRTLPYKLKESAKLWCVVIRDVDTDEVDVGCLSDLTKEWFKDKLKDTTEIIAHNGIKFDLIALKLFGVLDYEIGYLNKPDTIFGKEVKITDTLILSRLLNPDRRGGHSLKAWGERKGEYKDDFRQQSIDAGLIEKNALKGREFSVYSEIMVDYCIQDTKVTVEIYKDLKKEYDAYSGWVQAEKIENKLADISIRRESYGFWFDKDLAIKNLDFLVKEMDRLSNIVNPLLPPKKLNKTNLKKFTPPASQFKKSDGSLSAHMKNFMEKNNIEYLGDRKCVYEGEVLDLPLTQPLKLQEPATIDDLDLVKEYLIALGWVPTEWKLRDLTKDSKKQTISYVKRIEALNRWLDQTFDEGRYKKLRLRELGKGTDKEKIKRELSAALKKDKPVRVPTSPSVRVGVEKELCKNLQKLGDKVAFAKDFVLYLTYKHRKSSIAGGDIEDIDFDEEAPNTGYLSIYREEDGRIPTAAIEIGASTNRYKHIGVCNVPRASSVFGEEARSMFGCGKDMRQLGFDFSSLEACIQGHYILPFDGAELAKQLLAKKPNDIHSINAKKLGIDRDFAKAISYMLMYGGSAKRAMAMLGCTLEEAKVIVDAYWDAVPALKKLRDAVKEIWKRRGGSFVVGVDGRLIRTRSEHSLLNALFQSGGVICAKYTTVFLYEEMESKGYRCNPFEDSEIDMSSMIEYHDEAQLAVAKNLIEFEVFDTEEQLNDFKEDWNGGKLGGEVKLQNGKLAIALPNVVSEAVENSINRAVETVGLKVPLGMEWVVGMNWFQCH